MRITIGKNGFQPLSGRSILAAQNPGHAGDFNEKICAFRPARRLVYGMDTRTFSAEAVSLMSGLGILHRPVSTKNTEAQQFFDQGLRLVYAFNHEEAARSFRRAAKQQSQPAWQGADVPIRVEDL